MGSTNGTAIVKVEGLRKSYGEIEAIRGISFEIRQGEVFGLLGPNGAGKTSTIEILEGLRHPDAGTVRVCGLEPARESAQLKQRIGAQLQNTVLPDKITVEEALRLFSSFYERTVAIDQLMERFGISEKRRAYYETLSGGQKQRLALALALVNTPELVLLDEPTAGLDAMVRRDIYALIERLRAEKRTVLLTTHYIEEAERLCDRVAIVDHGLIVAMGTPRELVSRSGEGARMEVRVEKAISVEHLRSLEAVLDCTERDGAYLMRVEPLARAVVALVHLLETEGNTLEDLHITRPSLEDVFVEITGRNIED
jgi:ABC-2 type transport system ATP-binding protein